MTGRQQSQWVGPGRIEGEKGKQSMRLCCRRAVVTLAELFDG